MLFATPATNTVIRTAESEADAFGLDAAREPDGFAKTAMRLSEYRKIEPAPLEEALFFDHPSGRTRVRMAMDCGEAFADEPSAAQGRIGGDVFNTAARLEAAAQPGDVVVSAAAERMLRGRVDLVPMEPIELKGSAPIGQLWSTSGDLARRGCGVVVLVVPSGHHMPTKPSMASA